MEQEQKKKLLNQHEEKELEKAKVFYSFDSLLDLVDWSENDREKDLEGILKEDEVWRSKGHFKKNFCPQTWQQAIESALSGEVPGLKDLQHKLDELGAAGEADLPVWTHSEVGQALDVGAFLSGEPECFLRRTPKPTKKAIPIWVDCSFPCHTPAEAIINRMAWIVWMVDQIQAQGLVVDLRVRTETEFDWEKGKKPLVLEVEVDCRPVDLGTLAFLASPSFTRRLAFSVYEHYCHKNNPDGGMYGRGVHTPLPDEGKGFFWSGGYCYNWDSYHWTDEKKAKEIVEKAWADFQESEGWVEVV